MTQPISQQHYLELPEGMFAQAAPTPAPNPALLQLNDRLLEQMGVDARWFRSNEGLTAMSGGAIPGLTPMAMAYAGHQFGGWVPSLGDGRAHMLGQLAAADGAIFDVQLKGSGRTPFSRGGDGFATLGAVLREYMISEAMMGLGIASTGSIAVIATGAQVRRERPEPGAILVRSAQSHIRVGSFQYASANLGEPAVRGLADFMIAHHFPELAEQQDRYLRLLDAVVARQAELIAQWMLVGFIHGVMNTDNMSIIGETIDYGPCAFIDVFHPQQVFSSIDQHGRYAWAQQPGVGHWNLSQLAAALLPLLHSDDAQAQALATASLDGYVQQFHGAFDAGMRRKLGVAADLDSATSNGFTETTLAALTENAVDFTQFFDGLTKVAGGASEVSLLELFAEPANGRGWLDQWRALCPDAAAQAVTMRLANPAVIARNHRVEQAIEAAVVDADFAPFQRLCRALANPWQLDAADLDLQQPPAAEERVTATFCGT